MAAGQFVDYIAIEGADRINRLKFASLGKPPATLFDYTPTGGQLPAGELLSDLTLIDLKKVANASLGKWAGDASKLIPGLLPSFGASTDPNYASVKGVAFVYDNALAIESLLMGGTADAEAMARAFQIADALVVLQNFDPANLAVTADSEFPSLRPAMLRDAYLAGPAASDPAGAKPKVRLTSGFNNFSSGNEAYVAMALLRASAVASQAGDDARASNYLNTARELGLGQSDLDHIDITELET